MPTRRICMETNKVPMYKRILAFIIDFLLVAILSAIVMYVIPHSDKYNETLENSVTVRKLINESETSLTSQELINVSNELTYDSYKYGVLENSLTIVIMLSYFTLFTFFSSLSSGVAHCRSPAAASASR